MAGRAVAPGVRGSAGAGDPELHAVDEEFRRLLEGFGPAIRGTRTSGRRFLHADAVGVRGEIVFTEAPGPPAHPFFAPGSRYPVVARFSNGMSSDDVAPDVRGLSLMFLDPRAPDDLARSPFNLTLVTGRRLFVPDAAAFARFLLGTEEDAETLGHEYPGMRAALWDQIREPVSYALYHYHSQAPRLYVTPDGGPELARYRVVPGEQAPDRGAYDPGDRRFPPIPPDSLERDPGDDRPPSILWNDMRARVTKGGFQMLLQVQRHPLGDDPDANRAALDGTREWPESRYPYRTVATVRFDGLLDGVTGDALLFDPAVAPDGLGIALARSPHETASINHLRALLYRTAFAARTSCSPPHRPEPRGRTEAARTSAADAGPGGDQERQTVCVIGAGASGLTVACELERLGHRVVVLERAPEIAGKAGSARVLGHVYDLGAHICTTRYTELLSLACELGVETEPATPARVYDTVRRQVEPVPLPPAEVIGRYHHLREEYFPLIRRPGLAHSAAALARPLPEWLREHGVTGLWEALGTGYTSAGYSAGDIPALYFVKYAELTGLIPANGDLDRRTATFTVKGGFARLWRRVAEELADVRTGVRIDSIERRADGVTVRTGSGVVDADALVLTVPLDQMLPMLPPTPLERDIASRIRTIDYRTVLCRLSGVPREGFYLFPSSEGAAEGLAGYHSRYADQDVCTCYCYGAGLDDAALVPRLEERVAGIGGHLTEVLEVVAWPFMPHFRSEDVAAGIFDRLEKAQGEWRTYHAGSLLAFELIETTIAYARDLVRRFFTTPPRHIATVRVPAAGTSTTEEYGTTGSDAEDTARVPEVNGTRAAEADGARPQALPATGTGGGPAGPAGPPADEIREWLVRHVAVRLGDPEREVDPCRPIDEHGLDSLAIAELHTELSDWLGHPVPLTLLYRLPTLDALARYLESASR